MQFVERDGKIIEFIAKNKFVTAEQISQYMEMGIKATYRRLKKLVDAGYLKNRRIFRGRPGVYLAENRNIALATYDHDLLVVDYFIFFHYEGYFVYTEKETVSQLKRTIGQTGKKERVPDLVLEKGEEKIAVEIELTMKNPERLKKIINSYARSRKYDRVFYFCGTKAVFERVSKFAETASHIEVFKHERRD